MDFLCFVVFLTLKLAGGVDWSWGFILLPAACFFGRVVQAVLEDCKATRSRR